MNESGPSNIKVAHHNHYVPQFYLKRWSNNGNTIFEYDTVVPHEHVKIWRSSPIKSTACWDDFYTRVVNGADNDDFELLMNTDYETPAQPVFEKISSDIELTDYEMTVLVNYLTAQMVRVPQWYLKISSILERAFPQAINSVFGRLESEYRAGTLNESARETVGCESGNQSGDFGIPLKVELNREDEYIKVETCMGRAQFLFSADNALHGGIADFLQSCAWRIVKIPNGMRLPTSDNPVVVVGFDNEWTPTFNCGLGRKHVDIVMPLDPERFLFTEIGLSREAIEGIVFNEAKIIVLIRAIILNATRYVYSNQMIPDIQNIRPRQVERTYFEELNATRRDWHSCHSALEHDYQIAGTLK